MSQLSYGTGDISNGLLVFESELFKVNEKSRISSPELFFFGKKKHLRNWIEYISLLVKWRKY